MPISLVDRLIKELKLTKVKQKVLRKVIHEWREERRERLFQKRTKAYYKAEEKRAGEGDPDSKYYRGRLTLTEYLCRRKQD